MPYSFEKVFSSTSTLARNDKSNETLAVTLSVFVLLKASRELPWLKESSKRILSIGAWVRKPREALVHGILATQRCTANDRPP